MNCTQTCSCNDPSFFMHIVQYISNKMQLYTVYYIWKMLYMFRVLIPPTIRSAYNRIYSIWYLSHRYCYLRLSQKSWNRFECAVGGIFKLFQYIFLKDKIKCIIYFTYSNSDFLSLPCHLQETYISKGIRYGAIHHRTQSVM